MHWRVCDDRQPNDRAAAVPVLRGRSEREQPRIERHEVLADNLPTLLCKNRRHASRDEPSRMEHRATHGTLTADDVRDLIERHSDASGGNGRDFHNGAYKAIADELNTRAERTCEACYHGYEQAAIEAWKSIKTWNTRATHGTLTAEQVRECVQHVYHEGYSDGSVRRGAHIDETDWQATCEPNWVLQGETQTQEFWRCECGNCGECFGVEDRSSFPFKMTIDEVKIPNYCPNCGWKVGSE